MGKQKDEGSWKYGGIKRRDFRNGGVDEDDFAPEFRYQRHKSRNPCEAEGRAHVLVFKNKWEFISFTYETLICTRCGKHIYNIKRHGPVNPE